MRRKFDCYLQQQEWKEGEGLFCGGLVVDEEEVSCDEESGLNLLLELLVPLDLVLLVPQLLLLLQATWVLLFLILLVLTLVLGHRW